MPRQGHSARPASAATGAAVAVDVLESRLLFAAAAAPVPSNAIDLVKTGTYNTGLGAGGAEISAYDADTRRLFTVNGAVAVPTFDIVDLSDPAHPVLVKRVDVSALGSPNSVAVGRNVVAVAIQAPVKTDQGIVGFYKTNGQFLGSVPVGSLPDMLTFTPDGKHLLVANEGEPDSYGLPGSIDPVGSVSIVAVPNGLGNVKKLGPTSVATASFAPFDGQKAALTAQGVRVYGPGSTVAQDVEPEYIAVSADSRTAYVTLQENNAVAVVDVGTASVTNILPMGLKNHALPGNGIDASDADGAINIADWPVLGMYEPDAVSAFTAGGQTYLVTANEGDARDYPGLVEEVRVGSLALDPAAFPNAASLKLPAALGRLNVSRSTGDTDGDGDYDQLHALGGRSFSIRTAGGALVYDSGDALERITAAAFPTHFNAGNTNNTFEDRSDNKGPEPEGVATGVVNGRTYAFVGLERVGGVVVYDVTNPSSPTFVQYVNPRDFSVAGTAAGAGDLGPEGVMFVKASDSPTGRALVVVSNEVSGTVGVFEVRTPASSSAPAGPFWSSSAGTTAAEGDSDDEESWLASSAAVL